MAEPYEIEYFIRQMNNPENGEIERQHYEMALYKTINNNIFEIKDILVKFLQNHNFPEKKELYWWVLQKIGEIKEDVSEDIFRIFIQYGDKSVKAIACEALLKIGTERSLNMVCRLLISTEEEEQQLIREILDLQTSTISVPGIAGNLLPVRAETK